MTKERAERLQRVVDAVNERFDAKPSDVTLTWGELRELLSAHEEWQRWEKGCIRWRAWTETLAVRLGISKPHKLPGDELQAAVAKAATAR